jgi:hypothetical protein
MTTKRNRELEQEEKPYYVKENLFEHNGRTWEHLYDHPSGYKLRVFNEDMSDYDYSNITEEDDNIKKK